MKTLKALFLSAILALGLILATPTPAVAAGCHNAEEAWAEFSVLYNNDPALGYQVQQAMYMWAWNIYMGSGVWPSEEDAGVWLMFELPNYGYCL